MSKLVSVIVPVYNTEKYIERCIESILGQTYTNIELILVNDGSREGEEEIILKYAKKDSRIRYLKNERNIGLFKTRLVGVRNAMGKYIAFVDGDDYINADFIRLMVKKAEESVADMVFATTVLEFSDKKKSINIWQDVELRKLPLAGHSLIKAFMDQAGRAYVWHTVWNKLYTSELWYKCIPYLEKLDKHLIMTEDIAFSSVIYYFAEKADRVENAIYYYSKHNEASTSTANMEYKSLEKKLMDIVTVFQFIEDFYSDKLECFQKQICSFKKYYVHMWMNTIEKIDDIESRAKARNILEKFIKEKIKSDCDVDNYFVTGTVDYDDELSEIKKRLIESDASYISFDIFDTAIMRPFYNPSDMFYLLDKVYEKEVESTVSFHDIRIDAEIACRQQICNSTDREDITLDEIYGYIAKVYGIPEALCHNLKVEECNLEIEFSQKRHSVYELYEVAKLSGKKVIFISDMYLDKKILVDILEKHGYIEYEDIYVSSGFGKRKTTGNLYRVVLDELGVDPNQIIHIGDSIKADINAAKALSIECILMPKAIDVFEEKVVAKSNRCVGYGCMTAMVANKYFDNPFRYFHPLTTYNMDPYLMGYYGVGMNLIAQLNWLERTATKEGNLIFTARDGYMMHRAYEIYRRYVKNARDTVYMYTSRRAMLPVLLGSRADFMKLPVIYDEATPRSIVELLDFCSDTTDMEKLAKEYNIQWDRGFANRAEYHSFMNMYMEHIYNEEAHRSSRKAVETYWRGVTDRDAVYDMGYSGAIHYGIVKATGKHPLALYIHTDRKKHLATSRKGDFCISSFMDDIPQVSSIMREYFFSSTAGSCVRYQCYGDNVIPMVEDVEHSYCDVWAVHTIQEAALQMIEEFYDKFSQYKNYLVMIESELQEPFEELLRVTTKLDTKVFAASYFDDKVAGTDRRLGVRDYWLQLLLKLQKGNSDFLSNIDLFLKEKSKEKLAFWGTGQICEDILLANRLSVETFFDNNPAKNGTSWHGGIIFTPKGVEDISEYYIVIACGAYGQVETQLQAMGLEKYKDYVSYIDIF